MKKRLGKVLGIIAVVAMAILFMVPTNVKAENLEVDKGTLKLDDQWKDYDLKKERSDYIKVVLPSDGELTIKYTIYFKDPNYFDFLNEDKQYVKDSTEFSNFVSTNQSELQTYEFKKDLNKGTYYIRFRYMNSTGKYRVKASFKSTTVDEKEPNDEQDNANNISIGKYNKGYITEQDERDYYKFHISKASDYKFLWSSEKGNGRFILYNSDMEILKDDWIRQKNKTFSDIRYLKPGDYYIVWEKQNGTGAYQFKVMEKLPVKLNITKITLLKGKTKKLTVSNNEKTPSWSSSNYAVASVESNGSVKAKKYGKATITAWVDGKQLTCKVQVADPKLNKTSIKLKKKKSYTLKVSQRYGKVTWKSSKSSVVSVKNGKVTTKKKGTAYIYASCDGRSMRCKVTVK